MGGKKQDKAKAEAKKARQAKKAEKGASKLSKKEKKEAGEEDIEAIIAGFSGRDTERTAVSITTCDQPSPRSNFSLTPLPSGELLLFGGDVSDGQVRIIRSKICEKCRAFKMAPQYHPIFLSFTFAFSLLLCHSLCVHLSLTMFSFSSYSSYSYSMTFHVNICTYREPPYSMSFIASISTS